MTNIDTPRLEAEIAALDKSAAILCDIARRGGRPSSRELLQLRCLSASHAEWIDALIAAMLGELKESPHLPRGSGARGSDGGGPYKRR